MARILARFNARWVLAVGLTSLGPLLVWLRGYEPPWPEVWTGFQACCSITFSALAATVALTLRFSTRGTTALALGFLTLGLCLCGIYIWLTVQYVAVIPQLVKGQEHVARFVVGSELLPGIEDHLTRIEFLQRYGRPENIWTQRSLNGPRWMLLGSFVSSFASINFGLTLLACGFPSRRQAKAGSA